MVGFDTTPLVCALLIVTGLAVSITDLRSRKIYNAVTFPMILGGVGLNALPGKWQMGAGDWRVGVYGCVAGLGILFVPFALDMLKAGDVKYLAGVGALGGWPVALFTFLYGSLVHGLVCVVALLRRGELGAAFGNIGYYLRNSVLAQRPVDFAARSQGQVPYALSLALGCLISLAVLWSTGAVFPLWQ